MLNINHMCLLSVSALALSVCASPATAANIDIYTPPSISTHITHTALELKPLVSSGYNIAGLTWLPDLKDSEVGPTGNKMENDFNRGDPCKGYTLFTCPTHGTCKPCLVNNNKKQLVSCSSPYLVSGNRCICPQSVSLTYANDKCIQFCDGNCIRKTCDKSPNQTGCTNGSKACDDGCGGNARQCCVPCTDKITSKPANSNYTYSTCVDGEGSHQIQTGWACISGYHTKDSGCEKDCNATNCSGYALTSCPANGNCSKCTITATNCSTGGTKYKTTGCAVNYYGVNFGDCKTVETDCAVLGYTSDSCDGNKLKCPFGNKYACFEQSEPVAPPTTEDSRCAVAINGGCPYMPHYNYYMSCSYAAQSGLSSGERFRLCCGQRGCASNSAPSDSFSCSDGEVYHVCK